MSGLGWKIEMPTVHNFTLWDHLAGKRIMLAYKCTQERIEKLGGEIVPYTAEEVDESDLDDDGIYIPPEQSDDEAAP